MENSSIKTLTAQHISAACLVIITVIAGTMTLMHLKPIMVPFTLSVFLFFMVSPMVHALQVQFRIPRPLSIVLTLFLGVLLTVILVTIFSTSIRSLADNAKVYQERSNEILAHLEVTMAQLGFASDFESIRSEIQAADFFRFVQNFTSEFLAIVGNFGLILIYLIFFLVGRPAQHRNVLLEDVTVRISKYIWMKLIASIATGVFVGVTLALIGVDLAFMFGVLAFLTNFIPNVGFIIATVLPLPLAYLKFGASWQFLAALIIPATIQFIIGNFFEAKIMGKSLDLHPVTILFFLLFWGVVWGVPGMFLAVPMTAIIKLVLEQFPRTHFLAEILAGRIPTA